MNSPTQSSAWYALRRPLPPWRCEVLRFARVRGQIELFREQAIGSSRIDFPRPAPVCTLHAMKYFLFPMLRHVRMVGFLAIIICALPLSCVAADRDIAIKDSAAATQPTAAANGRKPILFIDIPKKQKEQKEALFAAWDAGLGQPTDMVSSCPGNDNRDEVAKIKVGEHAWMFVKAGQLAAWARTADQTDKNLRWLWYNVEADTPASERDSAIKSAKNLHAICAQHGWKFGIITDDNIHRLIAYAQNADALIFECQKDQNAPTARKMRGLAAKLREVNPQCLFGIQLGVGVPQKGYGGTEGAFKFYKATQDFVDLYSIWYGPPETMLEVLKKLDFPNPHKPPAKASPDPSDATLPAQK